MTLSEDTVLESRYRIDQLITKKNDGATYRAFDGQFNTPIILKEKNLQSDEAIKQFQQEALILTQLRHPSLPWVMHHFSYKDKQYLVTDFIGTESLWDTIQKTKRPYPESQAIQYILDICEPLRYLHQQNPPVVHQDIKPLNIKTHPSGKAVLVDFGIMKSSDPLDPYAAFLAPEQLNGQRSTPSSDIYALGATLYSLVTGQMPPVSTQVRNFSPENESLNSQLIELISKTMRFEPGERPNFGIFQQTLENILKSIPTLDTAPTSEQNQLAIPNSIAGSTVKNSFWLVDPTGVGYPVGLDELTIGNHPQANVRIDVAGISPFHAKIKTEKGRCLVMDDSSEQGTFLNHHRLSSGWFPFEPGDILVCGSTRFHITTTKPVKIGSTAPLAMPAPEPIANEPQITKPSSPSKTNEQPNRSRYIMAAIILLLLVVGGGLYFVLFANSSATNEVAIVEAETTNAPAPTNTSVVDTDTTTSETSIASTDGEEASSSSGQNVPDPKVTLVTPTKKATPVPTATEGSATQDTTIVVETTATRSPTKTPTASSTPTQRAASAPSTSSRTQTPTPTGPTVIPIDAEETVARIGTREVTNVTINPNNSQEVYALVKRDGIYKSGNGGQGPWAKLPVDASGVADFIIDPTDPTRLYASTWNAVLKSEDGGNTWDANTNGLLGNKTVDLVTVDLTDPDILYAGVGENLVASLDGGQTWSAARHGQGLGVSRIHEIVIDPFDHNIVYVAGVAGSLYKSNNGAQSFEQLPDNIGQGAFSMAAHPEERNVFLIGINSSEAAIMRSENGITFESVSGGLVFGGADSPYSAIVYAPSNPNIVYAGTGIEENRLAKGVFKSTNGGESWRPISNDLPLNPETGQPYYVRSIAVDPTNANRVFVATGNGLYQSSDGGQNWTLR